MTNARKVKVSVSLDADLLGVVDGLAASEGTTRSAVMERWLRQVSRKAAVARLEEDTAAYYASLGPAERQDDASWAAAAGVAARQLVIDEGSRSPTPKRRSRRIRRR
jgi:predicted transcriptional regulator